MKKSELRQIIREEIKKLQEKKQLNKKEVIQKWEDDILPSVIQKYESDGKKDIPARRESFVDFIDMLHRDGKISDDLVQNIVLPDKYEK